MTSELARGDLDDLRAAGLTPTDDDIIRLHALAARITNGPDTTAANAPRWAKAGGVTFYEPTLAAHFWWNYAVTLAEDDETADWLFAFACAHGRDAKFLDKLHDPDGIERALGDFLSSITATKKEVERALLYVVTGYDDIVAEKTELAKKREAKKDDTDPDKLSALEDILSSSAAATGLTLDDIIGQTPSRLCAMIYAAHVQAGMTLTRTNAKAHADYLATLAAIEKRLRAEKQTAEAAVPPPNSNG